jgi:hypothetical protein
VTTYVVTLPDTDPQGQETGFDRWDAWRVLVAMFPELSGDCMYLPPPDPHTGDTVCRHHRTGITVRRLQ